MTLSCGRPVGNRAEPGTVTLSQMCLSQSLFLCAPFSGGSGPSLLNCLPIVGYICHFFFFPGAGCVLVIFCFDCCHLLLIAPHTSAVVLAYLKPCLLRLSFPSALPAAASYLCFARINLLSAILNPC